ncbi:MAG: glycosyl transferase family 1 [Rubritepida sp.]|nr:glycosyl transferase family 1 [Rubritepida sp.]
MTDAPRIWIDGFALSLVNGTGIATYAKGLATTLQASGARLGVVYGRPVSGKGDAMEREVRFFDARTQLRRPLFTRIKGVLAEFQRAHRVPLSGVVPAGISSAGLYSHFTTSNLPPVDELWNANDIFGRAVVNFRIRRRLLALKAAGAPPPELMHWTHMHALRLSGTRNIYTIHDAIPMRLPWATLDHKASWLGTARALAASAEHIVTVSEHARQDLISLLGLPADRVTNTYEPVFPQAHGLDPRMSLARLRSTYQLEDRGYFLFLSAVDPRKNLARLLEAYLASGVERPFIIVGSTGSNARQELRLLTEANGTRSADGRIRHLGYLPRQDVDILLRHARALCFPSLYEGFGLPAIEAMQVGTPVLTSNNSALPEVVGDAALTVDPTDTRALAEAIATLDADDALRGRLEVEGPKRAEYFSPERFAARTAALYARLGVTLPGARA